MSEWKGPWKCEKCGRTEEPWTKTGEGYRYHHTPDGVCACPGRFMIHDRRATNPLAEELREAFMACHLWASEIWLDDRVIEDHEAEAEALRRYPEKALEEEKR